MKKPKKLKKSTAQLTAERLWGVKEANEVFKQLHTRMGAFRIKTPSKQTAWLVRADETNIYLSRAEPTQEEIDGYAVGDAGDDGILGINHFEARRHGHGSRATGWHRPDEFYWMTIAVLGDKHPEMYAQDAGCVSFWPSPSAGRLVKRGYRSDTTPKRRDMHNGGA